MISRSIFALIALIILGTVIAYITHPWWTSETMTVNSIVNADERCDSYGSNCKYLVYTEDEVFRNEDTLYHFKYNSSDVQRQAMVAIKNNRPARLRVYGFRIPFFSAYRNVVWIEQ